MGAEAGEIVEVQGGHIVRSTGRKDRHSKVCTAKGPRDRRVRLSAHTAIQFYDVQDRLGYDRPSKAVDWLIKKAKSAIDQLDHLPPWNPTSTATTTTTTTTTNLPSASASEMVDGGLLPPSLDSDSIADTIKSFFPVAAADDEVREQHEQELNRHSHPHPHFPPPPQFHEFGSGSGSGSSQSQSQQDLRLSLQSFPEDPILFHHQHQQQQNPGHQALFAGFGWSEHQQNQRIAFGGGGGGNDGGGFVFNSLQLQAAGEAAQPLFGRGESNHMFFSSSSSSQRGPLQSSNTPSVRANWIESTPSLSAMADHHQHQHHQISQAIHHQHNQHSLPASVAGIGMGMGMGMGMGFGGGGFSGFHHIPARIQGEEEHNGGSTGLSGGKPSSASSDSRH